MKLSKEESVLILAVCVVVILCAFYTLRPNGIIFKSTHSGAEILPEYEEAADIVNVNTASKEELIKVEGITNEIAEDIISYRAIAPFKTLEELLNIEGIDVPTLEYIEDSITLID